MREDSKILFVDDEPNVLKALTRMFLEEPYTVRTAASGQEGLEVLEKEEVQIVISDYRMPSMNGVEFLREVRLRKPQTIRIVLSGYADIAYIVAAINEGQIYKFIPKPWNDDELKVTVANAVELYDLYEEKQNLATQLKQKNDELTSLNSELANLLEEKSRNLEFRSKVVVAYQNILDSISVGILGVDLNDIIVLCNSTWTRLTSTPWSILGQDVANHIPNEVAAFIQEVHTCKRLRRKMTVNGVRGILSGVLMDNEDNQKGIILAFSTEDICQ